MRWNSLSNDKQARQRPGVIPDAVFNEAQHEVAADVDHLWSRVQAFHDTAKTCLDSRKNENA